MMAPAIIVLPTEHHGGRIDLLEVVVDSVDQFLFAGHTNAPQRHFAELVLDKVQPGPVGWCEYEKESLG